jgi:hypothetical protein
MRPAARKTLYVVAAIIALFLGLNALVAPLVYYAKPFHGRVVDAWTHEPIAGAIIGARWVLWMLWIGNRDSIRDFQTITDANGNYAIPGAVMLRWPPIGWLEQSDPSMVVFKSGYKAEFLTNGLDRNGWIRRSQWDGIEIELYPFQGTPEFRLDQLDSVLSYCGRSAQCYEEILKERPISSSHMQWFFPYVESRLKEVR